MLIDGLSRSYKHHFKERPTWTLLLLRTQTWHLSYGGDAVKLSKLLKEYTGEVNWGGTGRKGHKRGLLHVKYHQ